MVEIDAAIVALARDYFGTAPGPRTRILVADVLDQVANGMAWEAIIENWRGAVSHHAIAESVRLAREVLMNHPEELVPAAL